MLSGGEAVLSWCSSSEAGDYNLEFVVHSGAASLSAEQLSSRLDVGHDKGNEQPWGWQMPGWPCAHATPCPALPLLHL